MPFIVFVAVLVAVAVSLALWLGSRRSGTQVARGLRLTAAVLTLVVAAAVVGPAWDDSGSFALVMIGIPVVCAGLVLLATVARRAATLAAWISAVVLLLWSLLTGLGLGGYFLAPAILMIAAAAASSGERRSTRRSARPGTD